MDDSRISNISELSGFLKSAKMLVLKADTIDEKYKFIAKTVKKTK